MRRAELRALAEALLCEATGAERVTRLCPTCGASDHGQPRLVGPAERVRGVHVSLAYADGLVTLAWSRAAVGVDVERLPGLDTATARTRSAYAPAPREPDSGQPDADRPADLAAWTRLEAMAKAAGTGLRDWPHTQPPPIATRPLHLPPGYVGTLADPTGQAEVRLAGPAARSA